MSTFILYRYQFAPVKDRMHSLEGNMNIDLPDDKLMAKKQEIFEDLLSVESSVFFRNPKKQKYEHRLVYKSGGFCVFRLANTRRTRLEKHFVKQEETYGPSCLVIIDNRKDCQFVAIEKSNAFENSDTVCKILQFTFESILEKEGLHIKIQSMYESKDFWQIVNAYEGKIKKVRFDFSYPNLPTLNRNVKEMIKSISQNTQSAKSSLVFESEQGKALNIHSSDADMINLAEAGADSGDEIKLGINGMRSSISVGKTNRTMEIDRVEESLAGNLFQRGYDMLCEKFNKLIR